MANAYEQGNLWTIGYRLKATGMLHTFEILRPANEGGGSYRVNPVERKCLCRSFHRTGDCRHLRGLHKLIEDSWVFVDDSFENEKNAEKLRADWDRCQEDLFKSGLVTAEGVRVAA